MQIDTSFWDKHRGKIFSRKGGWLIEKGVFCHGYEINRELVGKISYFQMMILNATGRLPERRFADLVEANFIGLSWPDPRIWCNQIGALGGSVRTSVVAATVAGVLSGDSRTFAQKPVLEGMGFIQRALALKKQGKTVEEIVDNECKRTGGKPMIVGYARPIANGDERVAPVERLAKEMGFEIGDHLQLAYDIESILSEKYNEVMNINGYISAFLSDHGYSAEEGYRICAVLVNSGVTACYIDTLERPPESFLPMRCDDIDYQGPPPRKVPDKE
ncbi:MAG: hypothetical protein KAT62_01315 [Desulfuromonadales bacterium]|nr:hypothetical protein [Desulfuromonadales bacterium]